MCGLLVSCVSTPPPSAEETAILQRSGDDLERGDYEWVLYDMEKYIQDHPESHYSAEAHLLIGDGSRGQVDAARKEKEMTGMILTTHTAPLVRKAYENYMTAAEKAMSDEVAAKALYKAAVILDVEYMKDFEKALAVYGSVLKKFPGTIWAERAQLRYDNIDGKFRTLQAGPHMIPGQ